MELSEFNRSQIEQVLHTENDRSSDDASDSSDDEHDRSVNSPISKQQRSTIHLCNISTLLNKRSCHSNRR